MQLRYLPIDPLAHETPLLALGVPQGATAAEGVLARLDARLNGAVSRVLASGEMPGRAKDEVLLRADAGGAGPARILLLGLGRPEELDAEGIRRMAARAVRAAERMRIDHIAVALDLAPRLGESEGAQAAAEGAALAAWRFNELKAQDPEDPAVAVHSVDFVGEGDANLCAEGVLVGAAIARGQNLARTLQSRPGNVATPTHLAEEAVRMGASVGLHVTVFDEARIREEGMHALLAVSRGSEEEARFIVLEHRGGAEGSPPLVLVGKGLSFDAGGISLKPADGMENMKFDMSGGAAVLGAMQAIAELGLRANVVGIVPSSENLPSGSAMKPGDVIGSLGGKTIEVINTDAEGRLILADALSYACRLNPAAIVDCATLTGAVVVGLGNHAAAVLGNDDELVREVIRAGEATGERCWQLPLWPEYRKQIDSEVADLKNTGGRPGGTITAAWFLAAFVGSAKWAHLDIAGTAYGDGDKPYQRKGGYGFPTRLLVQWVRGRIG